jgi:uncharacterized membrane protein YozB (DUF420 family)
MLQTWSGFASGSGDRDMTTETVRFAPRHAWDGGMIVLLAGLVWLGILMGFGPEVIDKIEKHTFTFPLIVHIHAAAFVGWLVLLTTQITLIRTNNKAIHRKLGYAGAVLASAMVVLGLWASYVVDHAAFGTPRWDPAFLSIQLFDMVAFAGLAGAGVLLRNDAPAHRRLMLLATFAIVDAGFSRWWGPALEHALGKNFFGEWVALYAGNTLLVVALGAYDLITRRRLHPAYIVGATWLILLQAFTAYLYVAPWWAPVATKLVGR